MERLLCILPPSILQVVVSQPSRASEVLEWFLLPVAAHWPPANSEWSNPLEGNDLYDMPNAGVMKKNASTH